MTTAKGVEIITSEWRAAGILDVIELGSGALSSIDPLMILTHCCQHSLKIMLVL